MFKVYCLDMKFFYCVLYRECPLREVPLYLSIVETIRIGLSVPISHVHFREVPRYTCTCILYNNQYMYWWWLMVIVCLPQMLKIFESFLTSCNYIFLKMDGTSAISSRQHLIKRFNEVIYNQSHDRAASICVLLSIVGSKYICISINYTCWRSGG